MACNCILPKKLRTLCEMGCIYREKTFKHMASPTALKSKTVFCVVPPPPKNESSGMNKILVNTKKNAKMRIL